MPSSILFVLRFEDEDKLDFDADKDFVNSPPSLTGALRPHCISSHGDVYHRGVTNLWDHHKLYNVLPGRTGFLNYNVVLYDKGKASDWSQMGMKYAWSYGNTINSCFIKYQ